jgi:hypothetical protein
MKRIFLAVLVALLLPHSVHADEVPACRLDHQSDKVVKTTVERALASYKASGKDIGLDQVAVNPVAGAPTDSRSLTVYVITNAAEDGIDAKRCATKKFNKGEALDSLSVTGACSVVSIDRRTIVCSADAVKIFAFAGEGAERASPALLYVLSHEIGHIYQKKMARYSGHVINIALASDAGVKLEQLRSRCTPTDTELEAQADEYSLDVLRRSLAHAPYREHVFSEQGSLFWNIDLLALAADKWAVASIEQEFMGKAKLHKSFEPTEFPTSAHKIKLAARKLVCEVITSKKGAILVPQVSTSHPSAEQRLRRIAEVLKPVARALPKNGGSQEFKPVVRIQQDLSPIFTQIYRETGVYMEALEGEICTLVNAPEPRSACK